MLCTKAENKEKTKRRKNLAFQQNTQKMQTQINPRLTK